MIPLASVPDYMLPFVGPGTYLIFGIVLLPVYLMLAGWLLGSPRERTPTLLGVGYLVGITTALWGGLFVVTMVIKFAFF
jgi:hypothetical protein